MNTNMAEVVAVVGPTASGKSALAVRLALALDGEVVSGDSMQIYRGMDIGTAKVTPEESGGIPHHLLDLRSPRESFSAAEYQALARQAIAEIAGRGRKPLLAGGSGLYIDSALYNYEYQAEGSGATVRKEGPGRIRPNPGAEGTEHNPAGLWEKLKLADPESAGRLHPNDTKRILRALEYQRIHGKPISRNKAALEAPALVFPAILIGLNLPREILYQRIDARVDRMMETGLLAEVSVLRERGDLEADSQAGQAIGYKQLIWYLDQKISLDQAVSAIKRESRRYAKRQLTWFRRNPRIVWLDADKMTFGGVAEGLAKVLKEGAAAGYKPSSAGDAGGLAEFIRAHGLAWKEDR